MNEKESFMSGIWTNLHKRCGSNHEISLKVFTEAVIETKPEITYEEYCYLTKEFFARRGIVGNSNYIPKEFCWFVREFAKQNGHPKVFIPFATGFEGGLFEDGTDVSYHFYSKENEEAIKMVKELNTIEDSEENSPYDLIVASLPLGPLTYKSIQTQVVESCVEVLSKEGYCIFSFAKMITLASSSKWLSELEQMGLFCNAIIDMPMGAYAPFTMVDSEIVVFSKRRSEKIFTGLMGEEEFAEKIVSNFLNGKPSTNGPKLGVYVEGDVKYYSDYINVSRIQNKGKSLAKNYNSQLLKISQIASIHAPDKNNEFKECDNAVYVPKLGNSPVITDIPDFHI